MAEVKRGLPPAVRWAVDAVSDRKGSDLLVLDLRRVNDATDFFVAHHVEGVTGGRWVLIDFVDFVVHLFHPQARAFYQLERLWSDAPVALQDSGGEGRSVKS